LGARGACTPAGAAFAARGACTPVGVAVALRLARSTSTTAATRSKNANAPPVAAQMIKVEEPPAHRETPSQMPTHKRKRTCTRGACAAHALRVCGVCELVCECVCVCVSG
jgi:hypothetical protein